MVLGSSFGRPQELPKIVSPRQNLASGSGLSPTSLRSPTGSLNSHANSLWLKKRGRSPPKLSSDVMGGMLRGLFDTLDVRGQRESLRTPPFPHALDALFTEEMFVQLRAMQVAFPEKRARRFVRALLDSQQSTEDIVIFSNFVAMFEHCFPAIADGLRSDAARIVEAAAAELRALLPTDVASALRHKRVCEELMLHYNQEGGGEVSPTQRRALRLPTLLKSKDSPRIEPRSRIADVRNFEGGRGVVLERALERDFGASVDELAAAVEAALRPQMRRIPPSSSMTEVLCDCAPSGGGGR
jgi:hypothetical protein